MIKPPFETKKPIILPKQHEFTKLLVARYHQDCKHENDCKHEIPSIRTLLKTVKANYQRCKLKRAKPEQPLMGQLPLDRVAGFTRPFTHTGIDYSSPYNIVIGRRVEKRWVAIFTCSTTRAAFRKEFEAIMGPTLLDWKES